MTLDMMSFGGKNDDKSSIIAKRFVSETEIEEIKKKREEEWELARKEGRKIEREEDVIHDGRTLYERLKEQKDKKQEEFEEQLKFKNMIYKGLDKEDAGFLSEISQQQAKFHSRRFDEDDSEMQSYRAAVETMLAEKSEKPSIPSTSKKPFTQAAKSTAGKSKIAAVIVRKRPTAAETTSALHSKQAKIEERVDNLIAGETSDEKGKTKGKQGSTEGRQAIVAKSTSSLKGLIEYSDSESDDAENG